MKDKKGKAKRYTTFGEHRTWLKNRPAIYKDRKKEARKYAARKWRP